MARGDVLKFDNVVLAEARRGDDALQLCLDRRAARSYHIDGLDDAVFQLELALVGRVVFLNLVGGDVGIEQLVEYLALVGVGYQAIAVFL